MAVSTDIGATNTVRAAPSSARALLADVAAFQTVMPRRPEGRHLLNRITRRLDRPSADQKSDAKACEALLYEIRTECLQRHGIRDFPPDPNKTPPLRESLSLYQRIDAHLSASENNSNETDPNEQTENR